MSRSGSRLRKRRQAARKARRKQQRQADAVLADQKGGAPTAPARLPHRQVEPPAPPETPPALQFPIPWTISELARQSPPPPAPERGGSAPDPVDRRKPVTLGTTAPAGPDDPPTPTAVPPDPEPPLDRSTPEPAARRAPAAPWEWVPWGYELDEPDEIAWTTSTMLIPRYDARNAKKGRRGD